MKIAGVIHCLVWLTIAQRARSHCESSDDCSSRSSSDCESSSSSSEECYSSTSAVALLAQLGKTFSTQFNSLAVFGDSLTDNGPDITGDLHGFKKFVSGPNWAEYISKSMGVKTVNYAYSGALSGYNNYYNYPVDWSGALWQVDRYIQDSNNNIPQRTLIMFQTMGINDFFLTEDATNITQTAANIYTALSNLATNGAKHILVLSIFDLGPTPGVRADPAYRQKMHDFVVAGNVALEEQLEILKTNFPNTNFYYTDVERALLEVEDAGELRQEAFNHHVSNTTYPYSITEYAHYDDWHFSTFIHSYVALEALRALLWDIEGRSVSRISTEAIVQEAKRNLGF